MKVFCVFLVLFAVFQASQAKTRVVERVSHRTPFVQRKRINVTPSIVGGHPADIENFPHHLGIVELHWGYICGASNIHQHFALTAAHCLEWGTPPNEISLIGGSTSRLTGHTTFFIDDYVLHPSYDWRMLDNDIAIMMVNHNSPLQGPPHVAPITLSEECGSDCCDVCEAGPPITVVGWGVYNLNNNAIPENLLQVQKAIHNQEDCDRLWGDISESMFCTVVENGIDSCNGDSGGAIIRNGIQVGAVSFGSEVCGDGTLPAVYVRLEAPIIRRWILAVSGV